jgi:hypothetical protein
MKSTSSAEHSFVLRPAAPNAYDPAPKVFGYSTWDIPDGGRLRREMSRSTRLYTPKEILRWGRKWADITENDIARAIAHLEPLNN